MPIVRLTTGNSASRRQLMPNQSPELAGASSNKCNCLPQYPGVALLGAAGRRTVDPSELSADPTPTLPD